MGWVSSGDKRDGWRKGEAAAVAQHTLQSLITAGLHNEAPSPTACACV